jgi:hypothetical protein
MVNSEAGKVLPVHLSAIKEAAFENLNGDFDMTTSSSHRRAS